MRRRWLTATATMCLGIGLAAAQTGAGQGGVSSSQSSAPQAVTVIGCVARAGDALGSGAGAAGSSTSAADQFMLTSARMSTANTPGAGISGRASGQAESGAAPGSTGAAGSSTSAPRGQQTFMLEGQTTELREQVGHQVEITGRLQPIGSTGGTRGAVPPASGTGTGTSSTSPQASEKLQVQSVRMIAMSCPG